MEQTLTINEMMSLMKVVRERINSLKGLRQQVAVREKYYLGSGDLQKSEEPQYDVKAVDRKIMELENFIFQADSKIKQTNAMTHVPMNVDVEKLLEPLQ